MEGILLIDKPHGLSSFEVVRRVRRITAVKKVGHAGTLDPKASGLLIICLGRYTKLASCLMHGSKVYRAVFRLGETTASDDGETPVILRRTIEHLTNVDISTALASFIGEIEQIPPKFSAVKLNGQRAYHLARANGDPSLSPRPVEVYELSIEKWSLPEITLTMHCSKGTYVRSLARDLGEKLGVGAYAREIRRLKSGPFSVDMALELSDLDKDAIVGRLLTGRSAVLGTEIVSIDEVDRKNAIHGRKIVGNLDLVGEQALAFCGESPIAIVRKGNNGVEIARVI